MRSWSGCGRTRGSDCWVFSSCWGPRVEQLLLCFSTGGSDQEISFTGEAAVVFDDLGVRVRIVHIVQGVFQVGAQTFG